MSRMKLLAIVRDDKLSGTLGKTGIGTSKVINAILEWKSFQS